MLFFRLPGAEDANTLDPSSSEHAIKLKASQPVKILTLEMKALRQVLPYWLRKFSELALTPPQEHAL